MISKSAVVVKMYRSLNIILKRKDSVTSETNTSEDWTAVIEVCERADESPANARTVVQTLSKRILHKNVNV